MWTEVRRAVAHARSVSVVGLVRRLRAMGVLGEDGGREEGKREVKGSETLGLGWGGGL